MPDQFSHLKKTIARLPTSPGVYQMKDKKGKILYIGKATSLRSRVRSYFRKSAGHTPRISAMVSKVRTIDLIVTSNESEALLLEDNLIKENQPRYNVLLKDDKNYPYLKLTRAEKFPRLLLVRQVHDDGAEYFGPYVSAKSVRATMRLLHKIFPLRQSRDILDGKPVRRPCLNHQMGLCLAPCAGKADEKEYADLVLQVSLFLKGDNDRLVKMLEEKMWQASADEKFETSARIRDQLTAIRNLGEKQKVSRTRLVDEDVIAFAGGGGKGVVKIFQVRKGKLRGDRDFVFDNLETDDSKETLSAFVRQFYGGGMQIPKAVIVPETLDDQRALCDYLSKLKGAKVTLHIPQRGARKNLINMARLNAKLRLESLVEKEENKNSALLEITDIAGLDQIPSRIEAFDISNTGGLYSVGSMAVFVDGLPAKKEYRKYKISTVQGADDYKSMAEVIGRRLKRLEREGGTPPDLILIDGGKGQLSAVIKMVDKLSLKPVPMIGIAKGSDRENPESDRFFPSFAEDEIVFAPTSPGRFLLLRLRDEAHRFAIEYHKKLRDGKMKKSVLDNVRGVGAKRKKTLLKEFGSVKGIKEADIEEVARALKMSIESARKILDQF